MKFLWILTTLNLMPMCLSFWGLKDTDVLKKKVAAIAPLVYLPSDQNVIQSKMSDTSATLNNLPVTSYNYQYSPLVQYPLNSPYFRPYSPIYSPVQASVPLNQAFYYTTSNSQSRQPISTYNYVQSVPYPSQSLVYPSPYPYRPGYQPIANPVYQVSTPSPLNQTNTSTSTYSSINVAYPTISSTTQQKPIHCEPIRGRIVVSANYSIEPRIPSIVPMCLIDDKGEPLVNCFQKNQSNSGSSCQVKRTFRAKDCNSHAWIAIYSCQDVATKGIRIEFNESANVYSLSLFQSVKQKCDGTPEIPLNSQVELQNPNRVLARYTCNQGFTPKGSQERFCNKATGLWEPEAPICDKSIDIARVVVAIVIMLLLICCILLVIWMKKNKRLCRKNKKTQQSVPSNETTNEPTYYTLLNERIYDEIENQSHSDPIYTLPHSSEPSIHYDHLYSVVGKNATATKDSDASDIERAHSTCEQELTLGVEYATVNKAKKSKRNKVSGNEVSSKTEESEVVYSDIKSVS